MYERATQCSFCMRAPCLLQWLHCTATCCGATGGSAGSMPYLSSRHHSSRFQRLTLGPNICHTARRQRRCNTTTHKSAGRRSPLVGQYAVVARPTGTAYSNCTVTVSAFTLPKYTRVLVDRLAPIGMPNCLELKKYRTDRGTTTIHFRFRSGFTSSAGRTSGFYDIYKA